MSKEWEYDDLWEDGYRFDNASLKVWCVVPKEEVNSARGALVYLFNNLENLKMHPHT